MVCIIFVVRAHWVLRNAYFTTCVAASLPRERECIRAIESGMPGRGKQVNSTAKTNVYKYFERESTKSKYRDPPKLTHKTVEATGYGERTVRRIVVELRSLHQLSGTRWIGRE